MKQICWLWRRGLPGKACLSGRCGAGATGRPRTHRRPREMSVFAGFWGALCAGM